MTSPSEIPALRKYTTHDLLQELLRRERASVLPSGKPSVMKAPVPKTQRLLEIIAEEFGISLGDILGHDRSQVNAQARCVAMVVIRDRLSLSLIDTARAVGLTSHTSVHQAPVRLKTELAKNPHLRKTLGTIHARLSGTEKPSSN